MLCVLFNVWKAVWTWCVLLGTWRRWRHWLEFWGCSKSNKIKTLGCSITEWWVRYRKIWQKTIQHAPRSPTPYKKYNWINENEEVLYGNTTNEENGFSVIPTLIKKKNSTNPVSSHNLSNTLINKRTLAMLHFKQETILNSCHLNAKIYPNIYYVSTKLRLKIIKTSFFCCIYP